VSVRAILFDFNGTLSHDEALWAGIYRDVFAAHGRPITAAEYGAELAGLSDEDAVRRWFGPDEDATRTIVAETVARFVDAVRDEPTVSADAVAAVAAAAEAVPVGIVTTATHDVLDPMLAASGLDALVRFTVTADDVARTKPDPEAYRRALAHLDGVDAGDVLVFEDTPVGVAAATAAGLRCVGVLGTVPADRLAGAEQVVARLDAACVRRFL
jgi:HAD superfamily hydrolase (TIGR01509 family)